MIDSITLLPCGRPHKRGDDFYFRKLYGITSKERTFNFKDGLNLIIGPNACGKSTLMQILAKRMSIMDDNVSQTISNIFQYVFDDRLINKYLQKTYEEILNEGRIGYGYEVPTIMKYRNVICYYLTRNSFNSRNVLDSMMAGIRCNSSDFNGEDMFSIANDMLNQEKYSNGEKSFRLLSKLMKKTDSEQIFDRETLKKTAGFGGISDEFADKMIEWQKIHSDSSAKPTLMLDEPEEGMDILNQFFFWQNVIPKLLERYQIILISHSVFAMKYLKDKNANIISFFTKKEEKMIKECEESFAK